MSRESRGARTAKSALPKLAFLRFASPFAARRIPSTSATTVLVAPWFVVIVCLIVLLQLLAGGCLPETKGSRSGALASRVRSRLISPAADGIAMTVLMVERPFGDATLNNDLWQAADEEQLEIPVRRMLEQYGFRVAVLGGSIPATLKTLLNEEEVGAMLGEHLEMQSGVPTQIQISDAYERWPARADDPGTPRPEIAAALATMRVVPTATRDGRVELACLPELQFGEPVRHWVPEQERNGSLEWSIQVGRQLQSFDELRFTVRIRPGQFAMLGCRGDDRASLGARCFHRSKEGRSMQRVLLIEAEAAAVRTAEIGSKSPQ